MIIFEIKYVKLFFANHKKFLQNIFYVSNVIIYIDVNAII